MAAYHLLSLALWRFRESVLVRSPSLSSWLGEWVDQTTISSVGREQKQADRPLALGLKAERPF